MGLMPFGSSPLIGVVGGEWRVAEYGFERSLSMRTTDHGPPMPRRSLTRSRVKSTVAPQPAAPAGVVRRREWGRRHWLLVCVGGLAVILVLVLIGKVIPESPAPATGPWRSSAGVRSTR